MVTGYRGSGTQRVGGYMGDGVQGWWESRGWVSIGSRDGRDLWVGG